MTCGVDLDGRLTTLLRDDGRAPRERARLVHLMVELGRRPPPPDPDGHFPRYPELHAAFLERARGTDGEALEEAFLELYAHLHMHEAPYSRQERARMDAAGGYWAHAGGLSPILVAPDHLGPGSVSADFGAGNGLQGLLFQLLAPHRKTVQIEISAEMIAIGRRLQAWLGIPDDRVEWIVGDVMDQVPRGMDLIYLYRPVRPDGPGRAFYERFAEALETADRPVVILSIADCLREFLPHRFVEFRGDGHLTCYRG